MKKRPSRLAVGLFLLLAATCRADIVVPLTQPVLLGRVGHGFNFGDALEAPHEGDWGVTLKESYFAAIHDAGFKSVRIPIAWAVHVGPGPGYVIDPAFVARVDWAVQQAEAQHLTAILDYHNDDALMKNPDANADRFVAIWKQVAEHYFSAPNSILFELLNEPNGNMDAPHWNALLQRTLQVIRVSNPQRIVVVGPVQWNGINALSSLQLPADDLRLAVTIHYYDPMTFTHQGAEWVQGSNAWLGNKWEGTEADKKAVTDSFARATDWGRANRRPIFLGEFGSYHNGDMASRVRWTGFVVRTAEENHFPWTYWEFCAGFGAYDPQAQQWRVPLLGALKK